MATNLKYKVYDISSSPTSDANTINEVDTFVAYVKKYSDTTIRKLVSLSKK